MQNILVTDLNSWVDTAYYQSLVKDIIQMAKKKGATQVEVATSFSQGLSLTMREQEVETIEFNRDKGLGITVYCDQKKGSASTNDLSPKALERVVEAALHLAQHTQVDPCAGLAESSQMAKNISDCDLFHPWALSLDEAKDIAKTCEQAALSHDPRLSNTEGATLNAGQSYYVYGNSHGFIGGYPATRHGLSCVMIGKDEAGMQRDYQYTVSRVPNELWTPERVGQEAAQRTIAKLGGKPLKTQNAPIIFSKEVASSLFSHFCGAISGGALYRKASFLCDSLDKPIFHPKVQISERPHLKQGLGSAPFDGDGVETQDRDFVDAGVLKSYILSAYSARKLGMENTGHAGGVHNLIIEPHDMTLEDLIKGQDKALLVTSLMGQGVNMVTGDYSRGASGFWIENGEIQYPVHEVTIAGNLRDMFKQMSCITNDVDKRGNIQAGSVYIDNMMIAGR